jgi:putative exosortase-associated protein (TIGR04073 family)
MHYKFNMKRSLCILTAFVVTSVGVMADIQAPPGSTYTPTRKLGRALSNIFLSMEVPEQIVRKTERYGSNAGWTYGLLDGYRRSLKRFGYGWYELVTFYCPTYKGTFKPPYERCGEDHRIEMNPHDGLSEFPPTLGFDRFYHVRTQKW